MIGQLPTRWHIAPPDACKERPAKSPDGDEITLALASRLPFAIRTQNDSGCGTQADDRILREVGTKAATIQAKDAKGAENKRDPVQDNARQMSQAYAVHGIFASVTNPADVSDG